MPRSKKQSEQMRAQSRASILQTARRLFAEQGYFSCRVADIAREAGMSQGNVYWYFPSKEELLKAILDAGFEAVGDVLKKAQSYPGSGVDKLVFAVDQYFNLGREGCEFFTIFLSLQAHSGNAFLQELGYDTARTGRMYHQSLFAILSQAQSEGDIEDMDINILIMLFFGLFNGLIVTYGDEWTSLPIEPIRRAVLRLIGGAGWIFAGGVSEKLDPDVPVG